MGFWSRQIGRAAGAAVIDARRKQIAEHNKEVKVNEKARQYLKQTFEACDLVNVTTKPDEFFSQYALILENFEKLIEMHESGVVDISKYKPRENHQTISEQFTDATNDFIGRFFDELQTKVSELSSENAKADLIKRYFRSMDKYIVQMETDSINYYYSLKEQYLT